MPRVNVWIPDPLHATVRQQLPGLNLSAVVQGALAAQLRCDHAAAVCDSCSTPIDLAARVDERLGGFYRDALAAIGRLMESGGTCEGAARVLKDIAGRHRITLAGKLPLPRLSRQRQQTLEAHAEEAALFAAAERARVAAGGRRRLDASIDRITTKADSQAHHPTARRTA